MSRLHNALEGLASQGTPRGAGVVFSDAVEKMGASLSEPSGQIDQGDEIMISTTIPARKRPAWLAFAATFGAVLIIGVAVTLLVRPDGQAPSGGQDVAGGGSTVNTAVPGPTLAPADSVPVTVPAEAPLSYYTYLPDLHLAWRATTDGAGTEICWKTPEGEGCQSDLFYAPDTIVVPNGSQAIILTRPALGDSAPGTAEVQLSNGETTTRDFVTSEGIAIAYARIDLPAGTIVESATALP